VPSAEVSRLEIRTWASARTVIGSGFLSRSEGLLLRSDPAGGSWSQMATLPARDAPAATTSARFEDFVTAQHLRLFRALCLLTGDRHEAEEIMQEAFLRLWRRWDRVSELADPEGFLYRVALNVFRSRYRRAAAAVKRVADLSRSRDAVAALEDQVIVLQALRTIKPRHRAALVLTALLGYSAAEAGNLLGLPAGTVRVHAQRGREAMRREIGEMT
jgi:RNA polymerase sigma-70 factor (ECF subfamily)